MKPPYKVLHDKAMEFVDEAQLAKMEGNIEAYEAFLEKAFMLEKEAALKTPTGDETKLTRYLYLRSAAYLAFDTGRSLDAIQLTLMGLSGAPPAYVAQQLKDLKAKLQLKNTPFQLVGLFIQADAKDNMITVVDESSQQIYLIQVPNEKIRDVVRNYWSARVAIQAKMTSKGSILLEKISAAA